MSLLENQSPSSVLKKSITFLVSIGFAVVFMGLAFRGLDLDNIANALVNANYFWVFLASIFGILAYGFRAVRWNLLLEPMGYQISNANALWTISFGYLMNLTIPRSGELARATALYGVEKVPVDKSFGTIILERIVDLICMMVFLLLTLLLKYNAILAFYQQSGVTINTRYVIGTVLFLAVLIFVFFRFKSKFVQVRFLGKIIVFLEGIFHGLATIFKLKQKRKFILLSLAIWICYYWAAYLVCFSLPETAHFTFSDGFFIIVVGTLGMMIPASGGVGAFHFAMKMGIGALFFSYGKSFQNGELIGLSYAFISHTLQLVIMTVMGVISIPMLSKARSASKKAPKV